MIERKYSRLLSTKEIEEILDNESLFISPLLEDRQYIGPMGIDLRLDGYFLEITHTGKGIVDPFEKYASEESTKLVEVELFGGYYTLQPGKFVLGQTFEYIHLPKNVFAILDGRSSLGRLGIVVHSTAMSVDPGWGGHLTFELLNNGEMPVKLHPLVRVARLILFETSDTESGKERKHGGKYNAQVKPRPSKVYDDPDIASLQEINKIIKSVNNDRINDCFPKKDVN
ncbi:MAG TPA: dCTP deaminase [Nitrososphaeraceae archaeon]